MQSEYSEKKKLKTPGLVISLGILAITLCVVIIPSEEISLWQKIPFLVLILLYIFGMFWFSQKFILDFAIDRQGIRFSYSPILRKEILIPWEEIIEISVVKYDPIRSFKGWGIGKKNKRLGKSFTTEGNLGIYIRRADNENLLIGIQNADQMKEVLRLYAPAEKFLKAEIEDLK